MVLEHKIGIVAGFGYSALGLLLAAPSLGWYDSGELIASAFHLGVAHPTGFPAVMLGAKLMTFIPFGEVGLRTTLLSVLTSGLAIGLAAALSTGLARRMGIERLTAAIGGLLTAFGLGCAPTIFQSATGLEAYAPSLALLAIMIAIPALARPGTLMPRDVCLVAFIYGLAASTHALLRIEGLIPLIWAFWLCSKGSPLRLLLFSIIAISIGVLVTTYLPLASWRDPPLDWGDPESLERLWDHLMGGRIRRAFADRMLNPAWWALDAERFALLIRSDVGLPACGLACIGLGGLLRQRPHTALLLATITLVDGAYCVMLNPMGIPDRQVGMPLFMALCLLAGLGITLLGDALSTMKLRISVVVAVGLIGIVGPSSLAMSRWWGPAYGPSSMIFESLSLPPRSVVLGTSDTLCSGLLWAQYVEGDRPDVLALPRQHLWDRSTLNARLPRHAPELLERPDGIGGEGLTLGEALDHLAPNRPIYWERGGDDDQLRALDHERFSTPFGLGPPPLFRIDGDAGAPREATEALETALLRWYGNPRPPDLAGRIFVATSYSSLATLASERGDTLGARALLETSLSIEPRSRTMLNLSALEVRAERYDNAMTFIEGALDLDPGSEPALVAAGKLHLSLDRDAQARPYFERAQRLCPSRCGAPLEGLGIIAARAGEYDVARSLLTEALHREPSLEDARTNLRLLDRVAP